MFTKLILDITDDKVINSVTLKLKKPKSKIPLQKVNMQFNGQFTTLLLLLELILKNNNN